MCMYKSKKRGLSEILRRNSKSKERIRQLDEVSVLKEKLARKRAGIDIKSLSLALACPEDETGLPV